jgi:hypothetical protein
MVNWKNDRWKEKKAEIKKNTPKGKHGGGGSIYD